MTNGKVFEIGLKLASVVGLPARWFVKTVMTNQSNLLCLVYHGVTQVQFEEHMQFLDKHFQFIDLNRMVEAMTKRRFPSDLTVAVTFDDGLKTFYRNAFPVVRTMGIPVTVYVTSGLIDSEFWLNRQLDHLILNNRVAMGPRDIPVPRDRKEALDCGYQIQQGMRLNELKQVDKHPKVIVGAHTINHQILTELGPVECRQEIEGSKRQLERWLRHDIRHFAYPNGNYSSREMKTVRELGFDSSAAVEDRWITTRSNLHSFPRKGTGPIGSSLNWLMYRISR